MNDQDPHHGAESSAAGRGRDARGAEFYDVVGGHAIFAALVDKFYEGVASDPVLVAMYPEEDLEPAKVRLTTFLEQYWGGPRTYLEQRGHPRLRMRHQPFRIDHDARDRWIHHMRVAIDSLGLPAPQRARLWDYLERAAHSLVNTDDSSTGDTPALPITDPESLRG